MHLFIFGRRVVAMLAFVFCVTSLFAFAALADPGAAAASSALQPVLDFIVKIAPFLAALGLFHVLASGLKLLWIKVQVAAGKTPTKIDDFLVHLLDPAVQEAIRLADAGDVEAVRRKLVGIAALAKGR
jgi:hypothetical protein